LSQIKLQRLIRRSLSLPRKISTSMRARLRFHPPKALNFRMLIPDLSGEMIKGYTLGYRLGGKHSLPNETRRRKKDDYWPMASEFLVKFQKSTNKILRETYDKALANGMTENQATKQVLRRFGTIGFSAPAANNVKSLYTTAITAAYNQGIFDADRTDPGVWGFRYKTKEDAKVRTPQHAQFNNVTLPRADPFWNNVWPPIDYNCRCVIKSFRTKQRRKNPPANPVPVTSGFEGYTFQL
jgi:SPP1 gp7 family putative phage head morphogenesis protein